MNLTLKTVPKTVPLSSLKPSDVFILMGSKFVILKQHPDMNIYPACYNESDRKPLKFIYCTLPGDLSPFSMFGTSDNYQVEHLGTLVNADEQIKNVS